MYEFVGAAAARSVLIEGELSQTAMFSACIGLLIMQVVASYTGESTSIYSLVFVKYCVFWLLVSAILGLLVIVASGFGYFVDTNPRTRAWPNGPKLPFFLLSTREVVTATASLFLPLSPETDALIRQRLGYGRLALSISTLFLFITVIYFALDYVMPAKLSSGSKPSGRKIATARKSKKTQ